MRSTANLPSCCSLFLRVTQLAEGAAAVAAELYTSQRAVQRRVSNTRQQRNQLGRLHSSISLIAKAQKKYNTTRNPKPLPPLCHQWAISKLSTATIASPAEKEPRNQTDKCTHIHITRKGSSAVFDHCLLPLFLLSR